MTTALTGNLDRQVCNFFHNGSPIRVETPDLTLAPVVEGDLFFYQQIHTDPETMKLYADSEVRLKREGLDAWKKEQLNIAAMRVSKYIKRWTEERSPFGEFVIWKKEGETSARIGFVTVATHSDKPGSCEVAVVISKQGQGQKLGTQVAQAILHRYVPALIEIHYKLYARPLLAEGAPLTMVTATARLDNSASLSLLEKMGMQKVGEDHQSPWGRPRAIFRLTYQNPPALIAKL